MRRRCIWVILVATAALSCSSPPDKERKQADAAIVAAEAADAGVYVPDELKAAQDALAKYDDAVAQRDYRQALSLALQARDTAYDAARHAGEQQTALHTRADGLVAEVTSLSRVGAARLSGAASPRITGPASDRLRTALRPTASALQEARTAIAAKNYQAAVATLTPVAEGLRKQLEPAAGAAGRRGR